MSDRRVMRSDETAAMRARIPGVVALGLAGMLAVASAVVAPRILAADADVPAPQPTPNAPLEVIDVAPTDGSPDTDVLVRQCLPVTPDISEIVCTDYLLVLDQQNVQVGDTFIVRQG